MSTGMAIMGFGGGALIASPLSDFLMRHFASPTSTGRRARPCVVLGVVYLLFMMGGAFGYRVPPPGLEAGGLDAAAGDRATACITRHNVTPGDAIRTPQFWLLWVVLCLNVTAGIGVLGQASRDDPGDVQGRITASAAAGFVGLLSLFNMAGRFVWASLSDKIGRKATYMCFFVLGTALYALVPLHREASAASRCSWSGFCLIISMYGGGFATIPAYLATCSGPSTSAPCTAGCSPPGRRRACSGRCW